MKKKDKDKQREIKKYVLRKGDRKKEKRSKTEREREE